MSHNTSSPSGILNAYLYDLRTPYEKVESETRLNSELPAPNKQRSTMTDIEALDRFMKSKTDERLLCEARKEHRGMLYLLFPICGQN